MTPTKPDISIIIPVLNESEVIPALLCHLNEASSGNLNLEIIVVDGGSTDATAKVAHSLGAKVITAPKGRAAQMNTGARASLGGILYFLHADTLPPKDFDQKIMSAMNPDRLAGCFRMRFDHSHPLLRFFAWCSRINIRLCRGGDQSLFIDRHLFEKCGGFNQKYRIYEDSELIGRLYRFTRFTIIADHVVTSARKYRDLGIFKLQYHFGIIHLKNFLGAGPEQLYSYYNRKIAS
ncbi:TIGR04283 family arsenosugar biosynthesis glycosyltransferase [Zeaxanthinibacter sp. PT1]|uniref:TIGR04283 family arsenosugar biosynthesis glycosyltransferase n=1 Tax=Zeaxanthinibacter TaxID=561554 RepID=UPI002349DBD3|nr:TIGR04283 family arsenosugar biosynthesis glycosyltransferase [Zeaxanthinibacter sp. PT1]MDC6351209.1 TIGR04283 family arsenosugar biosynthesis glycosyltransferase [Zeaxanthinibacter sp. PT1]